MAAKRRIKYQWGAALDGIGWALAFVSMQLIAFFTSAFTLWAAAILFVPLGIFYSLMLRRFVLTRKNRRIKAIFTKSITENETEPCDPSDEPFS